MCGSQTWSQCRLRWGLALIIYYKDIYILYHLILFRYRAPGLTPEFPEVSKLEYFIERVILWILNYCVVFLTSLVLPHHVETSHGWEWIDTRVGHKRKPLSNSGGHANKSPNHILVRTQHNNIAWDSRVKWQCSILSARSYRLFCQPIRNWGIKLNFRFGQTLLHTTILSNTHYYSLSHTLLYSLA
jgi:hypothetical protein